MIPSAPLSQLRSALAGRYEIERELGRGGMATVYLARDLRHQRLVALKLLDPELGAVLGAERFLSEIRVTANLQHPNLLPLFDSGEANGFLYYVMPFVDGESLRSRLDRERQLPVDEAIRIGTAVAGALAYAHERGIIHRDLKPENILLQAGQPVVADFGIALAVSNAGGQRVTQTGLSLGTPQYMSPEQATGDRQIDARTDVYSLGAVVYEMLTGEPPHLGSTAQAIIAKLMTEEPRPPSVLRRAVPPHVDAAVMKALEKLPADRFATAREFAEALTNPASAVAASSTARGAADARAVRPWKLAAIVAGTVAVAALAGLATALRRPAPDAPVRQFTIELQDERGLLGAGLGPEFAISRDGATIVFRGPAPERVGAQLWKRTLADLEARPIPGTETANHPTISPDGRSVAFRAVAPTTAASNIKTIGLDGGLATDVATVAAGAVFTGLHWAPDGYLYYSEDAGLMRIRPSGGKPELVARTNVVSDSGRAPERAYRWPFILPNEKGALVAIGLANTQGQGRIAVLPAGSTEPRVLFPGIMASYAQGHIVYATVERTLMAVPFDIDALQVTGPPTVLAEGILASAGTPQFAVSESGLLAYIRGTAERQNELVWVGRDGSSQVAMTGWRAAFQSPALSPDGTRLAVGIGSSVLSEVWVTRLSGDTPLKLTLEGRLNRYPAWKPSSDSVTFFTNAARRWELWTKSADGAGRATVSLRHSADVSGSAWSPDGKWLVFRTSLNAGGRGDLYAIRPGVDSAAIAIAASPQFEGVPTISPDGRWLAYVSGEGGRSDIYVVPFPNVTASRWAVTTEGGTEPRWSPRGNELFYRDPNGNMVAIEVRTSPTFSMGRSTVLFSAKDYATDAFHREYDVSPDGQRFLMVRPLARTPSRLVVVENWTASIQRGGRR